MDMKRILQAMDGVATKPVAGANDMSKFLSIVDKNDVEILNEGSDPHKVSLPVQMAMQHYQKPAEPKSVAADSLLKKYFNEVETEVAEASLQKRNLMKQYANIIAERVRLKENFNPKLGPNPGFKPISGIGMMPAEAQEQQHPQQHAPAQHAVNHHDTLARLQQLDHPLKTAVQEMHRYLEEVNGTLYHLQGMVEESKLGYDAYDILDAVKECIEGIRTVESQVFNIYEGYKYHARDIQNRIDDQDEVNEDKQLKVPQKPRQGPLRTQTGGGAHRDKKKEQKQGKEKHKGQW